MTNELEEKQRDIFRVQGCRGKSQMPVFFVGCVTGRENQVVR